MKDEGKWDRNTPIKTSVEQYLDIFLKAKIPDRQFWTNRFNVCFMPVLDLGKFLWTLWSRLHWAICYPAWPLDYTPFQWGEDKSFRHLSLMNWFWDYCHWNSNSHWLYIGILHSVVSLAYFTNHPCCSDEPMLFTLIIKRRGLSIDPWGTPHLRSFKLETWLGVWTVLERSQRNDLSHKCGTPESHVTEVYWEACCVVNKVKGFWKVEEQS